jgi:hypothetical protein
MPEFLLDKPFFADVIPQEDKGKSEKEKITGNKIKYRYINME